MKGIYKNIVYNLVIIAFIIASCPRLYAHAATAVPPQNPSLLQFVIDNRPVLAELLTTAGLIAILSNEDNFTLLAPSEASLAALKNESPDKIKKVLSGHIIRGNYQEKDFKDGAQVETLSGEKIRVCRKKGETLLNGVRIVQADHQLQNGVLHELNKVMTL